MQPGNFGTMTTKALYSGQNDQRLPFGSRRIRDSLSTLRWNFHSRWNPVSQAGLRFHTRSHVIFQRKVLGFMCGEQALQGYIDFSLIRI
jgi:hypothetical protein